MYVSVVQNVTYLVKLQRPQGLEECFFFLFQKASIAVYLYILQLHDSSVKLKQLNQSIQAKIPIIVNHFRF